MPSAIVRRQHIPTRHVYDTIVVGGHLSGAITAALLARRGLHVLVVPHDGLSQPYVDHGFALPHRPFLMPPARAVGVFDDVLGELGLTTQVHRALAHPPLQILRPDAWFELRWAEGPRAAELRRALGDGAEAFDEQYLESTATSRLSEAFFAGRPDLLPEGPIAAWQARRAVKNAAGLTERSPLATTSPLRALLPFAAPLATPAPLSESRALAQLLQGPSTYPGGAEGLTGLFLGRAADLGADVVDHDTFVRAITFEGGGVALRLSSAETAFRAPALVGATDLELLTALMPEGKQGPARKASPRVRPTRVMFTMNVVVAEEGIPPGLGSAALVFPPGTHPVVYLEHGATPGHSGKRTLTASAAVPVPARPIEEAVARAHAEALWEALDLVLPFTRAHAVRESLPWLHSTAVVDRRAEPWTLFELGEGALLGVEGHRTGGLYRPMVLASRQVLPGLGLEGDVLAATRAVARVEKLARRSDPLKARKSA